MTLRSTLILLAVACLLLPCTPVQGGGGCLDSVPVVQGGSWCLDAVLESAVQGGGGCLDSVPVVQGGSGCLDAVSGSAAQGGGGKRRTGSSLDDKGSGRGGATRGRSGLNYGIEWGYAPSVYLYAHDNFSVGEGFRVDDETSEFIYESCGLVQAWVGVNVGRRMSLRLCAGYVGVSAQRRIVPVTLDASWHFCGTGSDGAFVFAGGGVAINSARSGAVGVLGVGHRTVFTPGFSIDFRLGMRATLDHPGVYDPDTGLEVPVSSIRANDAVYLAPALGISLNF